MNKLVTALLSLLLASPAFSQAVSMSGSLGDKALLIIDGAPRTMATGETYKGVKLIKVSAGESTVEVKGQRIALLLGGAQVNIGSSGKSSSGDTISLSVGSGGHFFTDGAINGKSVKFLVDTGATYVSMDVNEAKRLGLNVTNSKQAVFSTANGLMKVYRVKLDSVRIGDVMVYDVDAVVGEGSSMGILLGNSYLTHFSMRRDSDTLTLVKRY